MQEKLSEQAYFIYEKEIEYLLAAVELLCNYGVNAKIREIYTEEFVEEQKESHALLFEVFDNLHKNYGIELFEFLLDFDMTHFSIKSYFSHIRGLSKKEILSRFLQQPMELIESVIDSEEEQMHLILNMMEYVLLIFTGSNFSITQLPAFFQWISYALPLTRSISKVCRENCNKKGNVGVVLKYIFI